LTLASPDESQVHEFTREQVWEKVKFVKLLGSQHFIIAQIPKPQEFLADPDEIKTIKEWLGPPTFGALKAALKQRMKWSITIGVFFVFTSLLPLLGNPDVGLERAPIDTFGLILGTMLIFMGVMMRIWPRPELFLLDALWLLILAGDVAYGAYQTRDWFWALMAAMLVFSALGAYNQFTRFRGCAPPQLSATADLPTDGGRLQSLPEPEDFDHI
jgi:hypothetical protein